MKYIIATLIIGLGILNAQEHALGLIYEDLSKVPWMIEVTYDPAKGDPPPSVDHTADMPPVGNQGNQGSCVAWGVGYYYKTHQERVEKNWLLTDTRHQCSPAFMYNLINGGVDGGAFFSDAVKVLVDHGCAPMANFPYNQSNCTNWPSESAWVNALPFRSDQGYFINTSNDAGILAVKQVLADGDNAVLGINVYSNFDNINNFDTTYCVADKYGTNRGGHGVCIVGYDDNKMTNDGAGAFRLVNSWGTGWGNHGYWWMSYVAVKNGDLSHQEVCYTSDRINYTPTCEVRYKISHSKREWIRVFAGFGDKSAPLWNKQFFYWSMTPGQAHAFPNNNIVLDLSDGVSVLNAYDTNNVFVGCRDILTDGQTGQIQYEGLLQRMWGAFSISSETPVSIPDNGIAFANLNIPTQKIHWTGFHYLPCKSGLTGLTGDMDSVNLQWSYTTGGAIESSPAIGDIDDDGSLEVVVGSQNNKVYALNAGTGDSLWVYGTGNAVTSSPVLGDIDADGKLEVVVGSQDNKVYALNGEDGSLLWSYTTGNSVNSSPALGDVDGDGKLEIVVGSEDHKVYALNGEDGSLLWSYTTGNSVSSSPALGDIDSDGLLNVIVGSLDGRVYILNGKYGDTLRTYIVGAGISSSPALGDIDDDGKLEIVVGAQDHKVHAINNDASLLWSYSMINDIESSPAIGDIDKNGDLEVVVGCENGKVYALDGNGDSLWTYLTGSGVKSSPALGDVDGDTKLEIVVGSKDNKVYCLNGETGSLLWSYTTGSSVNSSPALGDIDGDNELEAVFGSSDNKIYALNGLGLGTEEITYGASPNSRLAMQCQPNPFKRTMVISYSIPRDGNVALKIYDATGRLVVSLVDGKQSAGYHEVSWDFSRSPTGQLPNGVYFSRLETDDLSLTEKVIMVR